MAGRTIPSAATEAPGNFIPSALWNTQITNGVYSFTFNPPCFKGTATVAQSISTGTGWSAVTLTSEITDTEGGWSSSVNPSRYTFQTPGRYQVIGNVALPGASSTDATERGVGLWVNSAIVRVNLGPVAGTTGWQGQCVYTGFFNVGDFVQLVCSQNSGASQSTVVASAYQQPTLELIWQGAH